MMHRILVDLFYGNIRPNEKEFAQYSRYGEAAWAVIETEQRLRELATSIDELSHAASHQ